VNTWFRSEWPIPQRPQCSGAKQVERRAPAHQECSTAATRIGRDAGPIPLVSRLTREQIDVLERMRGRSSHGQHSGF
jgi:hypothetical protein